MRAIAVSLGVVTFVGAPELRADEADTQFDLGQKSFDAGNFAEAETHYEAAFAARKSPDIAANLAQAELKLGKKREAGNHLQYALRLLPATAPDDARKEMNDALEGLKKELSLVRVVVNVNGATVRVGDEVVGTSPLPDPVFVEPGVRTVSAELSAHLPNDLSFPIAAGEVKDVTLKLTPKAGAEKPAGAAPIWPGIVLGAVAVGGLGLGVAGFAVAASDSSEVDELAASAVDGSCKAAGSCGELTDAMSHHDTFQALGITGISVAGAAGLGTLLYFALAGPFGEEPAVVVAPQATSSFVGISAWGRF